MLSIVCLTYNQKRFIARALDSFLSQRCDFDFEIVIHDDCSSDNTAAIVESYISAHPTKIRVITQEENQYSKVGLLPIYNSVIGSCKSKYIAYCEGDDYFVDCDKLQKQVDFMEQHPDCTLLHCGDRKLTEKSRRFSNHDQSSKIDMVGDQFENILKHNFITAPTAMFPTEIAKEALSALAPISIERRWQTADYPLWLYLTLHGKLGYIKDIMSIYQHTINSISNNKTAEKLLSFSESILDIKEYFIELANVPTERARLYKSDIAGDLYKISLRYRSPHRAKYREMFLEYQDIAENKKLLFYARHPKLEWLYF